MPPPDKYSLHEFAKQARLKWLDQFAGWSDDQVARGVIAKYPGDAEHLDYDTRKLFGNRPQALAEYHANRYGVDPDLIRRMLRQESGGHQGAVSSKGASGYLQLMPDTAKSLGVKDIFDPYENIEAGVKYFKTQLDRFKDPRIALAAYNAGPEAIAKHGYEKVRKFSNSPNGGNTTGDYVDTILKGYQNPSQTPPAPQQGHQIPQSPINAEEARVKPTSPSSQSVAQAPWFNAGRVRNAIQSLPNEPGTPQARANLKFQVEQSQSTGARRQMEQTDIQPSIGSMRRDDETAIRRKVELRREVEADQARKLQALRTNPNSAEARLYDPNRDITKEVYDQDQAEREQSRWYEANKFEIDRQKELFKRDINQAPGGDANKWINEMATSGAAGLWNLAVGAAKATAIVGTGQKLPDEVTNQLAIRIKAAKEAAEESGADRNYVSKTLQHTASGFIETAPALALIGLGIPAPAAFAAEGGTSALGQPNANVTDVAKGAAHGYGTGLAFELPIPGGMGRFKGTAMRMGQTGLATGTLAAATGSTAQQALETGLINAAMIGVPEGAAALKNRALGGAANLINRHLERSAERSATERIAARLAEDQKATVPQELQNRLKIGEIQAQGGTVLNPEEVAFGAKPKVRMSRRPVDADPAAASVGVPKEVSDTINKEQQIDLLRSAKVGDNLLIDGVSHKLTKDGFVAADGSTKVVSPDAILNGMKIERPAPTAVTEHWANRQQRSEAGTFVEGELKPEEIPQLARVPVKSPINEPTLPDVTSPRVEEPARPFERSQAEASLARIKGDLDSLDADNATLANTEPITLDRIKKLRQAKEQIESELQVSPIESTKPKLIQTVERKLTEIEEKRRAELRAAGIPEDQIKDIELRHAGLPLDELTLKLIKRGWEWYSKRLGEKGAAPDINEFADKMGDEFKEGLKDLPMRAQQRTLGRVYEQIANEYKDNPIVNPAVKAAAYAEQKQREEFAARLPTEKRQILDQMVKDKVGDVNFKKLLPAEAKGRLKKGETWQSRARAEVDKAEIEQLKTEARVKSHSPELVSEFYKAIQKSAPDLWFKRLVPIDKWEPAPKGNDSWKQRAATHLGITQIPSSPEAVPGSVVVTPKPEEPPILHKTLEGRTPDQEELYSDVIARNWDSVKAYVAEHGEMPPYQEFADAMNKVLPRTVKMQQPLRDAYRDLRMELATPKEAKEALESPVPEAKDPQTFVRRFTKTLADAGMPVGSDTIGEVHSDPQVIERAISEVVKRGKQRADDWVKTANPRKEEGDVKVAAGVLLMKIYKQQGETAKVDDMASFLARHFSDTARTLRAAQMVRQLSPEGILTEANKDLQNNWRDKTKRLTKAEADEILDKAEVMQKDKEAVVKLQRQRAGLDPEAIKEAKRKQLLAKPKARLIKAADRLEEKAKERIDYRKNRLGMNTNLNVRIPGPVTLARGIHPDMPEWIAIGTAKIIKGAVSLPEFTAAMVKEVGAEVRPYIEQVYRASGSDYLERKANLRREADINRVTEGKPDEYSPDEIEELLRLDKDRRSQKAKARAELKQRVTMGYPRQERTKVDKEKPAGPERPARLALKINELGKSAEPDVIVGAMKLMRTGQDRGGVWEREMAAERGLVDKEKIEQTFVKAVELKKQAEEALKVDRYIEKKGGTVEEAQQVLHELALARRKAAKSARDLGRTYKRLTMTPFQKLGIGLYDTAMIPKAIKASFDLSAPGRQGWVLLSGAGIRGRKVQQEAFGMMVQNALSRSWNDLNVDSIRSHPRADQWQRNGGQFTSQLSDEKHALMTLTPHEESFASGFVQSIPLVSRSEWAYSGYLDAVRIGYFDMFANELEARGLSERTHPEAYKDLVNVVSTFTGRGELKHPSFARTSNLLLWSPKFMRARFDFMNPLFYTKLKPEVRRIALRTAYRSLGTNLGFLGLVAAGAKAAGLDNISVNFTDPDDPDWLKIRWNDTRYDLSGGHLPMARFLYKAAKSAYNATQGNYTEVKDVPDLLGDFLRTKEAPVPALAHLALTGKDFKGEKLADKGDSEIATSFMNAIGVEGKFPKSDLTAQLVRELMGPMLMEDSFDAAQSEGWLGFAKATPASFLGMTVSTYKDKGMYRLREFPKAELNRLGFKSGEVMGQRTGVKAYDDVYEETLVPMIQSRVTLLQNSDVYKKSTDGQKALQLNRMLTTIREQARKIAEAKLTPAQRLELRRSKQTKREREAGAPLTPVKQRGGLPGLGKLGGLGKL